MQALLPAESTAYPSETIQYWSHLDLEIHCFLPKNLEFSNLLFSYGINLRSLDRTIGYNVRDCPGILSAPAQCKVERKSSHTVTSKVSR